MLASKHSHSRTRIRLTREGWVFVIILAFISLGAVLRNINLLIILSGMMLAPLLLGWRVCVRMMLDLQLQRNMPLWVHARQKFDIEWQCHNRRDRIPTWTLNILDRLREDETEHLKNASQVTALIPQIVPGQTEFATYRCLLPQRGKYVIGPAEASTRFPFGLIKGAVAIDPPTEIYVAPVVGKLVPSWDKRIQSLVCGEQAQRRRRGTDEDEFHSLREWRSGSSTRQIHWRTSAKLGKPVVKQFDQKSDRDFALAVDLYSLESEPSDLENIEKILSCSATMIASLKYEVQGKVAMAVCGQETFLISDQFNRELVSSVMQNLATAQAGSATQLGESLKQLFSQVSGETPLIVISARPRPDSFAELVPTDKTKILRLIESSTRWLQVGTPEFEKIFQMPNEHSLVKAEQSASLEGTDEAEETDGASS